MTMEIRNIVKHRTDGSKTVCPADMKLFSSKGWLRHYSIANPDMPSAIQDLYRKVAEILEEMKTRIPKLALYLSVKDTASTSIYCKCMLMSNGLCVQVIYLCLTFKAKLIHFASSLGSLPDFRIQWVDTTKLRYSLRSGRLHISGSSIGTFQWDGASCFILCTILMFIIFHLFIGVEGLSCSGAPDVVKDYLFVAQEMMRRCIAANSKTSVSGRCTQGSHNCTSKQGNFYRKLNSVFNHLVAISSCFIFFFFVLVIYVMKVLPWFLTKYVDRNLIIWCFIVLKCNIVEVCSCMLHHNVLACCMAVVCGGTCIYVLLPIVTH
jgi:hypothetical protein